MKILLLLSESWNDNLAPNNNMSNWFSDFPDAEIWTISGSGVHPANKCCKNYFLIGENEMLKSFFCRVKAGRAFHYETYPEGVDQESKNIVSQQNRNKQRYASELARLARDIVWRYGRINKCALKEFINEFQPDIVFSQRRGSVKMCRLERIVSSMTDAPLVAYTGDDEYSLQHYSWSPIFWLRCLITRHALKKTIPLYKLFYSMSERQMMEFGKQFNIKTKFLVKAGMFDENKVHKKVNDPITFVYAGKLYCNRWKTLAQIADAIRIINSKAKSQIMQLNVYTPDVITIEQDRLLNDGINAVLHNPVPASELPAIFAKSDVLLHVESFDKQYRLLTKDSFSTKVMDCLSSGCAVMAVCWEHHAAYKYLKAHDAAFVASNSHEIRNVLESIASDPCKVTEYAEKAYNCGKTYHQRSVVQQMIYDDLQTIINDSKC